MKIFKQVVVFLLLTFLMISLVSCKDSKDSNVFTGEGKGKNGTIKVEVTIENNEIQKIDVVENHESEFTKDVFTKVINSIVAQNNPDIDVLSGATWTSEGIITAVKNAVDKSGIKLTPKVVADDAKFEDVTTDIVVVGAGGAGLSASIAAKNSGVNVILVEKTAVVGGNTNYATGGLNAAETKIQKEKGIEDSVELFVEDTMKGGKYLNNEELVKVLAEKSAETVDWLIEMGADLTDVGRLGGASVDRAHRPTGGAAVGSNVAKALEKKAREVGVDIRVDNKAVELLKNDDRITGIKVRDSKGHEYSINAKVVILTTGGFGANQDLVVKYKPELKGFGTTNQPGATGDAIGLGESVNADFVDLEQIQIHPTASSVNGELITEAVRGNGAILVNINGERFINELQTRDVVSAAELKQPEERVYLVFDQNVRDSLKAIEKYSKAGLLIESETLEELAKKINVNEENLVKTVAKYNGFVSNKNDVDFGRTSMTTELNKAPYYALGVWPAVHHTMGGIKINTNAQVIDKDGNVIKGLYAAGEVTGGVHGANRLGGNAMADITIFGRIAGLNAAKEVK